VSGFPDVDSMKKTKESSSAYFQRTRPKFLDWEPPTEEQRLLEVQARREAKDRQLAKVTRLEKERQAAKRGGRK
jgi:regulator of protease activity HflC (stomatin/prohibitin superfamily)